MQKVHRSACAILLGHEGLSVHFVHSWQEDRGARLEVCHWSILTSGMAPETSGDQHGFLGIYRRHSGSAIYCDLLPGGSDTLNFPFESGFCEASSCTEVARSQIHFLLAILSAWELCNLVAVASFTCFIFARSVVVRA